MSKPKTGNTSNQEMTTGLLGDCAVMWVAKLPYYVTNQLLQGGDIEHDSGHFNPFLTPIEFDDSVGGWDTKGFHLYIHWELPILNGSRNIALKDKTPKKSLKTNYEAKKTKYEALLRTLTG
jgi:hypothetical protein